MLTLKTAVVENSIANALKEIAHFDCDFSGKNGTKYTTQAALEKGFSSDLDYCLYRFDREYGSGLIRKRIPELAIANFFRRWLDGNNCYVDYDFDVIYDENRNIKVIILALQDLY